MLRKMFLFMFLALSSVIILNNQTMAQNDRPEDRAAVRATVEKIFQAFVDKDLAVLRATHSDDWAGYSINSKTLSKGLEAYMQAPTRNFSNKDFGMKSYKFNEFEISFQANVALVFYVSKVTGRNQIGTGRDIYRSLDVYVKQNGNWIQVASNLARHPDATAEQASIPFPINAQLKQRILDAREAVWRAWFTNDQTALGKMIPDEAIALGSSEEKWLNKAEIINGAKKFAESGGKLVSLEFPRTEIQMYGNAITLYTSYLIETVSNGKPIIKKGIGTETFVIRNNNIVNTGWLLASAVR